MKNEKIIHRLIKKLAATRFNTIWLSGSLHLVDSLIMKITGGRVALSTLLTGLPYIELITTGAKSGLQRSSSLFCLIDEDKFILIASSFGRKNNPAWYYNLKANPQAKLVYKRISGEYLAREADGDERELYWQQAIQVYEGYQKYGEWASHRKIPIMVLEPLLK